MDGTMDAVHLKILFFAALTTSGLRKSCCIFSAFSKHYFFSILYLCNIMDEKYFKYVIGKATRYTADSSKYDDIVDYIIEKV